MKKANNINHLSENTKGDGLCAYRCLFQLYKRAKTVNTGSLEKVLIPDVRLGDAEAALGEKEFSAFLEALADFVIDSDDICPLIAAIDSVRKGSPVIPVLK